MYCHECGTKNIDTAKFCVKCGTATGVQQEGRRLAVSSDVGKNCSYCHYPIKPSQDVHECPACKIIHHAECWTENGGCTTYGCGTQPTTAAPAPVVAPAPSASDVCKMVICGLWTGFYELEDCYYALAVEIASDAQLDDKGTLRFSGTANWRPKGSNKKWETLRTDGTYSSWDRRVDMRVHGKLSGIPVDVKLNGEFAPDHRAITGKARMLFIRGHFELSRST